MKATVILTIIGVIFAIGVGAADRALSGGTIITEGAVSAATGFPFSNSSFDPYILAVDGNTMYFASVNVTSTYTDTQVFSFDVTADETTVAAVEIFNDSALKTLYSGTNSFWFYSSGDVAGSNLFTVTAEDSDGNDGEYIVPADIERIIRVNTGTGVIENVVAGTGADGATGLVELGGTLYMLMSSARGATGNGIATVSAAATDGTISYIFDEAAVIAATGGTSPELECIDVTPMGDLMFADNETSQILLASGLGGTPALSVLVNTATLTGTALGTVTVTGLGVFSTGGFVVSDTNEVDGADTRGLLAFFSNGAFNSVFALESQIVLYATGNDHAAYTPNNEVRVSTGDRLAICNTDHSESIYWMEDPVLIPVELMSFSIE